MRTRREIEEALAEEDLDQAAISFLAGVDGPVRHDARVEVTASAALAAGAELEEQGGCPGALALVEASGALALALDLVGLGGPRGCGGEATLRLSPFRSLGKGRKQASDGPAWMAAAREALEGWRHQHRWPRLSPEVIDDDVAGVEWVGGQGYGDTMVAIDDRLGGESLTPWLQATCRLALWHIAARKRLVETAPPPREEWGRFEAMLNLEDESFEKWGRLLEIVERELELEAVRQRLFQVGLDDVEPEWGQYGLVRLQWQGRPVTEGSHSRPGEWYPRELLTGDALYP